MGGSAPANQSLSGSGARKLLSRPVDSTDGKARVQMKERRRFAAKSE
jgi:hypothetical protein